MNIYDGVFFLHNLMQWMESFVSLCIIVNYYATGHVTIMLSPYDQTQACFMLTIRVFMILYRLLLSSRDPGSKAVSIDQV